MEVGTVIKIHGEIGIILEYSDKCAFCLLGNGDKKWLYMPNDSWITVIA